MPLSAAEQYLLELINRGRLDPLAEAERYGIDLNEGLAPGRIGSGPLQALTHNEALSAAAEGHSIWMLENDQFSHTGVDRSSAGDRMEAAGYEFSGFWSWRENLAWAGSTGTIDLAAAIEQHHRGLFLSSGHRSNTFSSDVREIGIAQVEGSFTSNGSTYNSSMLTENFALSGSNVFVTGVAYNDRNGDDFYSIGEGTGGIVVRAGGAQDSTADSGGYGVELSAQESANIQVIRGGHQLAELQMDVSEGNGKLDIVTNQSGNLELHLSVDTALVSGIESATLLGIGDLSLRGNSDANRLTGNKGDNEISGMSGRDRIYGGDGDDVLAGGRGKDRVYGQEGDDQLRGGSSRDRLFGNSGTDVLNGQGGRDILRGGSGDDILDGGRGHDRLIGGGGADTFIFNQGHDVIIGFKDDVDDIIIDRDRLGDQTLTDIATVENGNLILDFDTGNSLTIRGQDDIDVLLDDISIM